MNRTLALLVLAACAPKPVAVPEAPVPAPPVAVVDPLGPLPPIPPAQPWAPPTPTVTALANGAPVWTVPSPGLPLVSVVLTVPGGSSKDPGAKEGVAWLSDRMMRQGAGSLDATAFAERVDRLGLQLDVSTDRASSSIFLSCRRESLESGLDLMADMMLRPTYAAKDFQREKDLAIADLTAGQDDLPSVASKLAWRQWFGPAHPYGKPPEGTVAGMKAVVLKDLKAYHQDVWTGGFQFTVAGALSAQEATALLDRRFGAAARRPTVAPPVPPVAPRTDTRVVLVDKPGSAQTMFYWMFPGVPLGSADLPATRAGTIALGGTFTSRLNHLLREEKGYTYGAAARVNALPGGGALVVYSRIRTDATADAMKDFLSEFGRIGGGVNAEELGKARGAFRQDQVEAMESRGGVAATFAGYQAAGLGPAALGTDLSAMERVDLDAVKAQMGRYAAAGGLLVLVGDRAKIEEPLKAVGVGPFQVMSPL